MPHLLHRGISMLMTTLAQTIQVQEASDKGFSMIQEYGLPALIILAILFGGYLIAGWVSRITLAGCNTAKLDLTVGTFFARMAKWLILLLTGLFVLSKFGIETASFAVVIGSAGLAIGLALQGTLANFASGIMLLIFRPYRVGDVVTVAGQTGKVNELELFTTIMDTPDNRRIIVPNGTIFGSVIENITHHATRRVDIPVGVDYSADIDQTRQVLETAAAAIPGILTDPAPQIVLGGLGDSAVDWTVRVWCNAQDYWPTREAAIRATKMGLDAAQIGIPFPQMDVHVDKTQD